MTERVIDQGGWILAILPMARSNKQLTALLFADAADGRRTCRLCKKSYAKGNGYTNLVTHLRASHAAEFEQAAAGCDENVVGSSDEQIGGEVADDGAVTEGVTVLPRVETASEANGDDEQRRSPEKRKRVEADGSGDCKRGRVGEDQITTSAEESYADHKMELARLKFKAEKTMQDRYLALEAAKEHNRVILELVKLGKSPEEIEKLLPLFR